MNRQLIVMSTVIAAIVAFTIGVLIVGRTPNDASPPPTPSVERSALVRPHSPVIGPAGAPVTIVEFFDPSCEACRAFHPIVKQILAKFPSDVRLVLRYTPFHKGSDEAVRILEASRAQGNRSSELALETRTVFGTAAKRTSTCWPDNPHCLSRSASDRSVKFRLSVNNA